MYVETPNSFTAYKFTQTIYKVQVNCTQKPLKLCTESCRFCKKNERKYAKENLIKIPAQLEHRGEAVLRNT